MASNYEYIISLQDKTSAVMRKITGCSGETISRLTALSDKTNVLQRSTTELGGCLSTLRQRMSLLQQEKELINPANLKVIRQYNREIGNLGEQIDKLDNTGKGGKLKGYFQDITEQAKAFINPVTLGAAAIGFAAKGAMGVDEGMAKINITAQLDETGLSGLKEKLKKMAKDNQADFTVVPSGFEKIISQTGDVQSSLQIMDAALKGSKAGFVDLDTVTGALAQTLSIVGSENASAQEVLDTFFAAKRVGAGEFKDFATYMPGLIAGADSLGINYKSVAGVFAYMTGKGQDAAHSSVLMGNLFSVLGKTDITTNLSKAGVKIFDAQGKMRGMVDIFTDLKSVMGGMNDQQKSGFLEKIGIVDKEAKSAFAIMASDVGKLQTAMADTGNAVGETAKALELSRNPVQAATELWYKFKGIGLEFGEAILPIIGVGISVLGGILDIIAPLISGIVSFFGGWLGLLKDGNPLVWALTAALGMLTLALMTRELIEGKSNITTKARTLWDATCAIGIFTLTAAQWLLNASLFACPLVWIIAAIAALVGAIVWAWNNFEGFRKIVLGTWEVMKTFGKMLWDVVVGSIRSTIEGLGALGGAIGKLFTGDFAGAFEDAKTGVQKLWDGNPIVASVKTVTQTDFAGAWEKGKQKGADSWAASQARKQDGITAGNEQPSLGIPPAIAIPALPELKTAPGSGNYDALMKKIGDKKEKGSGKNKKVIDLNKEPADYKGNASYASIVSRLAPVKLPSLATAAASIAMPLSIAAAPPLPAASPLRQAVEMSAPVMPTGTNGNTITLPDAIKLPERAASPVTDNLLEVKIVGISQDVLRSISRPEKTPPIPPAAKMALPTQQRPPLRSEDATNQAITTNPEANAGRSVTIENISICDKIEIHMQSGSEQDINKFVDTMMSKLKDAIDDYEA